MQTQDQLTDRFVPAAGVSLDEALDRLSGGVLARVMRF